MTAPENSKPEQLTTKPAINLGTLPVGVVESATAQSIRADMIFRGLVLVVVCGIFIWLNLQVMHFVRDAFEADLRKMSIVPPMPVYDRLITPNVVMALIGATVVQTGAGFIAITSYLFPKRSKHE